jgi:transposase-like protein
MSKQQRKYTKEFKAEAVKLALGSVSVLSTSKELGIPAPTLHAWVDKEKNTGEQTYELAGGEKVSVNVGDVLNEDRELRKRLARLE